MHLVLATLNFPPARGGVEQLCGELARELQALGIQVHVLGPHSPGDAEFDATVGYRVTRYAGGSARHWNLTRALAPLLADGARHVLFGQWTAAGLTLAREMALPRGVHFSTLAHAKEMLVPERGLRATSLFGAYRRAVLRRMQPVICVSRYTADGSRAAGALAVEVVHPGVDSIRFAPGAAARGSFGGPGRPQLLTVARLVARKGIDTVIAALPELVRVHPQLAYVVVGDGPDRARLQALAEQHGVARHVSFLGAVDNAELPALYAAADLFLLMSRQETADGDVEGFGLVLLEAQACGTPVVAANSGGMPDALLPGETGMLVNSALPPEFSRALLSLLGDPDRLQAMRQAARLHASTCSWRAAAERVAALVER
jgi:phosphatidylinositol alpha-1,6-mannosyltransferase